MNLVLKEVDKYVPSSWSKSVNEYEHFELKPIDSASFLYQTLKGRVSGSFNLGTTKIVEVQNPFLFARFMLKKAEYMSRGSVTIDELFHDTASSNISSIVNTNLDWRRATRVKFGKGVSFSPSPEYANKESSRVNGVNRAMIIADVLIGKSSSGEQALTLPYDDSDTTMGNNGNVYVKYYDDEFYPKYVVYYSSITHQVRSRRRFW